VFRLPRGSKSWLCWCPAQFAQAVDRRFWYTHFLDAGLPDPRRTDPRDMLGWLEDHGGGGGTNDPSLPLLTTDEEM